MVLQALVVKKIDDVFGMRINTDSNVPISENLLKQFGISTAMLNSLNSANEKKLYIADTMTARISLMIKEWDEKQNARDVKLKHDVKLQQKGESRKLENQADMFDWLKIGTNHDHLQKKLRMTIIEKLTDFENQEEISKLRVLKQPSQQNIQDKQKLELHLKNLPYVSTKVLLLRMDEKDNKYLKEGMTKEQLDQYEEVQHIDYMNENKKRSNKQNSEETESENQQFFKKQFANESDELPEWSEELEKEFLNNKRMARLIYSQDIAVSSWSQQGYLPLVQEYNLSNKKKMEREQLITNYQNGIWLTEKELKFIADTSQLLNKCIDKQYVQRIVKHISKDDVSRLELSLAENIITNYENMQCLIREQRLKFLKERQQQLLQEREEQRKKQIMKEQKEKELKIQRRYVKMFKTIGDRLLSSKVAYTFEVLQQNFFCRLFFEKMRDILRRYRKRQDLLAFQTEDSLKKAKLSNQLANQKDFVKRLAKANIQKKLCGKQHELHPPSKVSYFPPSDEQTDPKRIELINFMIDRFQLTTRSKQEVRVQDNFQKFYSGGPQKADNDGEEGIPTHLQKIQLTKQQFAGIVRVQRLFRQFRMRRIIKNMKEQEFSIKQSIYRDKLKSYMSGRSFLKIAQKKSGKELIPEKKVIETIHIQDSDAFSESLYSSDDEGGQYKEDKSKRASDQQKKSQMSTISQQQNPKIITQTPQKEKKTVKDAKNFYHLQNNYGETLSTERHFGSKTVDDDQNSKHQNSTIKFLTNERNDTQSNNSDADDSQNLSNESPKTKASEQYDQYKKSNNRLKTDSMDDRPRISFTRCENTEGGSTHKNTNNNVSMGSFLTPKSLKYAPTLLLKQQKLLQAVKMNQFMMIKNSGFIINESDSNCKDSDQNTPLMYAIAHQNLVFIRWLICKGANVNIVCANGNTPVHQAFKQNNPEIIHDILCLKPNFNIVNQEGLTPLGYASLEILTKFDLKNAIVFKNDATNIFDEADTTVQNNNQLFIKDKRPLKAIGKVKINNFYPIKTPTIQSNTYTSM